MLALPADTYLKPARLRAAPKFRADLNGFYTGVHDDDRRRRAEALINELIDNIQWGIAEHPTKQFVLGKFADTLSRLDLSDTEDRERALTYLEKIMDCVGLESSDGLLNRWMYGFDPTKLP